MCVTLHVTIILKQSNDKNRIQIQNAKNMTIRVKNCRQLQKEKKRDLISNLVNYHFIGTKLRI